MTQQQPDLDAVARAITDLERGLRVYPGEAGLRAGARTKTPDDVLAPSLYRLYHATVTQHWVLDPNAAPDQRTPVNP